MPVRHSTLSVRLARTASRQLLAWLAVLLIVHVVSAQPPSEPAKKNSPVIRLPDGTHLFTGNPDKTERVELSLEEWRKLLDQLDQLKKHQGSRKPIAPSECRLLAKVEKRGDLSVVAIRATYEFRTVQPQAAVALGGRRAFPIAATLDGAKLATLETTDDGLIAVVATPGAHTLVLDLETPVTSRGQKGETGFEIGLPRAAITKLMLDPLPPGVKRVNLTTRTPDPGDPAKPVAVARESNVDVKLLAARPEGGRALGAIESLEAAWDPPATAAPAQDAVKAAEWEITGRVSDTILETSARLKLQGSSREWKFVAPANSSVGVERASSTLLGADLPPSVTRFDNSKTVWKVDFAGGVPSDWVITLETRTTRPKAADAKGRTPFPLGPFSVMDVFRQTGVVDLIGGVNVRLVIRHGASLRQIESPMTSEENETLTRHRLATGPTGPQVPTAALLDVEARPLTGRVIVRPSYRLKLTEAGWRVAMDVRVTPIRNEIDQIAMDLPLGWPTPDPASPVVDVVQVQPAEGMKIPASVKLANGHRNPFEFTLSAVIPVSDPARGSTTLLLPRFPQAAEGEAQVTVEVPAGKELRGTAHEWEGEKPSGWANPLSPVLGTDGKAPKTVTTITGRFDQGLARLDLAWQPHRPELLADIRADVDIQDRQLVIEGELRLRSPDALTSPIHCRGPEKVLSVPQRSLPFAPSRQSSGEWELTLPPSAISKDGTTAVVRFAYVVPLLSRSRAEARASRSIPIGLFWPMSATRLEATLRFWPSSSGGPVSLSATSDDWRSLPPEPAADRPALPALTLHGSGDSLDLTLQVQPSHDSPLAGGHVDRALVEVAGREANAPLHRRGLFRVRRWLLPSLEIEVPGLLAETGWSAFVDGHLATGAQLIEDGRAIRVPLPAETERGGAFVVEVRYRSAGTRAPWEMLVFDPPRVRSAAYAGPTRWIIDLPSEGTPLMADLLSKVEQRWQWNGSLPYPRANVSSADLSRWVREGSESESVVVSDDRAPSNGEAVVLRQNSPASVVMFRVPRLAFLAVGSLLAFTGGLVLTRLSGTIAGLVALLLAGAVGAAAVLFPQPASQAAAAALPGLLALGLVLAVQWGLRIYHRRRLTYLPGFTRVRIDPPTATGMLPIPAAPAPSARNHGTMSTMGLVPPAEVGPPSGTR